MDTLVDFLLSFYGPTPYFVVFGILLACGLGLPIPEDVTLFAGGLLAYYGVTEIWTTIILCFAGVMLGDALIFMLGAKYGRKLTKKWFFHKLLPDERLNLVSKKFKEKGNKLLFAARFMPGFRAPVYFSAGTLHVPFRTFILYDGLAALISVPAIVGAVYYFGDELDKVVRVIKHVENGLVFVTFSIIGLMALKWYITHRRVNQAKAG
ncbi:MAG: DedA family protein [Methylotenera sp.]|nr:DedA family protein [Oligoflexia bacterium]